MVGGLVFLKNQDWQMWNDSKKRRNKKGKMKVKEDENNY